MSKCCARTKIRIEALPGFGGIDCIALAALSCRLFAARLLQQSLPAVLRIKYLLLIPAVHRSLKVAITFGLKHDDVCVASRPPSRYRILGL